ncbi:MAG: bacillithiol biosynthesis cysteine-adding enzyme BshC [Firmicutes bacterium]|nr:bacillithiol biosynthesis cysteine-adding enzyme BshC [Bacillota bacterium]
MDIDCRVQPTGNALTDACLDGNSEALSLYDYDTRDDRFAVRRASDVDGLYDETQRPLLVEALRAYAGEIGTLETAEPLLQKLAQPGCLTVVTGQQAGLFTGPSYTVYKAISTVSLAKRLERVLSRPVVPVFWIAAEDHDFDEAASAYYVTRHGNLGRAVIKDRPALRTPVGQHVISDRDLDRLIQELSADLPDGLYREDVIEAVSRAYRETGNMADGFAALLGIWLQGTPMLYVNPLRPDLRALMRPAFSSVLEQPERFVQAAREGAQQVRAKGYTPQVEFHDKHTLLYLIHGQTRSALDLSDQPQTLVVRDSNESLSRSSLQSRLQERPQDFSGGVLYRPVTQDVLLPVLAYVGGAAEVAYHGMMGPIFHAAGRKVPPLYLRMRALHLPSGVARTLEAFGVGLDQVSDPTLLQDWLRREVNPPLAERVASLQQAVAALIDESADYFLQLDPLLQKSLDKTKRSLSHSVGKLEGKALSALGRKHRETVEAHTKLTAWLYPNHHEQERLLSPLSMIAKYGTDWVAELAEFAWTSENLVMLKW